MAHPKKNILMLCDSELQTSLMRFSIETRGGTWLRIWPAPSLAVAEALIDQKQIAPFECAIIVYTGHHVSGVVLARILKAHDIPFVIILKRNPDTTALIDSPHQGIFDTNCGIQDIVDRLRILCARKRGPKKTAAGIPLGDPIQLEAPYDHP